jgi:XisI protein
MDRKIKKYQKILIDFLVSESESKSIENIDFQVVTDIKHNHFQLIETGWYEKRFIYQVIFHFDINANGKVWILVNNTDILVAEELIKKGIPSSDIVLGFHPAHVRQYTGYAVA